MKDPARLPYSLTSLAAREKELNYRQDRRSQLARAIPNARRRLAALETEARRLGHADLLERKAS